MSVGHERFFDVSPIKNTFPPVEPDVAMLNGERADELAEDSLLNLFDSFSNDFSMDISVQTDLSVPEENLILQKYAEKLQIIAVCCQKEGSIRCG